MYKIPILYIVFNRPKETSLSFDTLRKVKPKKLYISADGPRANRNDDIENSQKVKDIVAQVDWDCEVKTLYHAKNLGCRVAPETALDWFFENEAEGIILEDDIIPNAGFFEFIETMLERYREDETIFSVNGCSLGFQSDKDAYGITRYFNMWGWATWRRSYETVQQTWPKYNPENTLENDPVMKSNLHLPVISNGNASWRNYWQGLFNDVFYKRIDTVWDYQWTYTVLKTGKFCIRPSENYVINVGSGEMATHHTFTEAPIFNFVYTAPHYVDKKPKKLNRDNNFELYHLGAKVHSFYFKSLTFRYFRSYLKYKMQHIKSKFKK